MNAHIIACVIGDEEYAVRDTDVRAIARMDQVQRAPGGDGQIGTLTVDRQTVPVHRLANVLGLPSAGPPTGEHIVVTESARGMVGWLVDRIVRARSGSGAAVQRLPACVGPVATAWFDGSLIIQDRLILLLSPARLDPRGAPPLAAGGGPRPAAVAGRDPGRMAVASSPAVVMFSTSALPRCDAPRYALSARQVVGVVPALPAIRVPGSPAYVAGLIAWRGEVIPVVDFRSPAERGAGGVRERRFLLARGGARLRAQSLAFSVDPIVTLHRPTRDDREQTTERLKPSFVTGFFGIAGDRVALLDLDALIEG